MSINCHLDENNVVAVYLLGAEVIKKSWDDNDDAPLLQQVRACEIFDLVA